MKKIYSTPMVEWTEIRNNIIATSGVFDEQGDGVILKDEFFYDFTETELL